MLYKNYPGLSKIKLNPFSGNSLVNHQFNKSGLNQLIDNELGVRVKYTGYQYGEILRNLTIVFLSGGDTIEDINSHFRNQLIAGKSYDFGWKHLPFSFLNENNSYQSYKELGAVMLFYCYRKLYFS